MTKNPRTPEFGRRTVLAAGLAAGVSAFALSPDASAEPITPSGRATAYFTNLRSRRQRSTRKVQWRQVGPGMSGYNEQIWCHPTRPDTVFMTPDEFNAYRSADGGRSWATMKDCDGNGDEVTRLNGMAFQTANDGKFGLAVNRQGLWMTRDAGQSWTTHPSWTSFTPGDVYGDTQPPPAGQRDSSIWGGTLSAVAFDPCDGDVAYVGSGDFFNEKLNPHTTSHPHGEMQAPAYYWRTNTGKLWKTSNHTDDWELINEGIHPQAEIGKIFVDPSDSSVVYAATSYGFYRSDTAGASWTLHNDGLDNGIIRDLTMHYDPTTRRTTLFAIDQVQWLSDGAGSFTSSGGVFRSTDNGTSWQNIGAGLRRDLSGMRYLQQSVYFRSLSYWFEISAAEARKQFPVFPNDGMSSFQRIAVDPTDVDKVYVLGDPRHKGRTFLPAGPWTTDDGGKHWYVAARTGTGWTKDKEYWEGRGNPTDTNMTWGFRGPSVVGAPYDYYGCTSLAVDTAGTAWFWAFQQVFTSTDRGASWHQSDALELADSTWVSTGDCNAPGRDIVADPATGSLYLLLGENGLWRIEAGAADGTATKPGGKPLDWPDAARSISTMTVHPRDPKTVYLIPDRQNHVGELRRSTDGGASWQTVGIPLPGVSQAHALSLTVDPDNPDYLYFCVPAKLINSTGALDQTLTTRGVYVSADGGKTWSAPNHGLPSAPSASVNSIALSTQKPGTLFAAVLENRGTPGGLFESSDHGDTWTSVPIPAAVLQVNHVHVQPHKDHDRIFISAGMQSRTVNDRGDVLSSPTKQDLGDGGVWYTDDHGRSWNKIFDLPNAFRATTSPLNGEHLLVAAGPCDTTGSLNPGIYLSTDLGSRWHKINTGIGQPNMVYDVTFDPMRESIIWATLMGAGGYVADISELLGH